MIKFQDVIDELDPEHRRWTDRRFRAAHEIDIIVRKDGKEYRYEGDFLKAVARALVPVTEFEQALGKMVEQQRTRRPDHQS